MAKKKTYGTTASGKPSPTSSSRRRGGRPPIGSAAASVESVRLDPELHEALTERAERDHETTSSVIRKALRKYLRERGSVAASKGSRGVGSA